MEIIKYCPQCGPRETSTTSSTCYWCKKKLVLVVDKEEVACIEHLEATFSDYNPDKLPELVEAVEKYKEALGQYIGPFNCLAAAACIDEIFDALAAFKGEGK